jgi:hypothetical protein
VLAEKFIAFTKIAERADARAMRVSLTPTGFAL